MTAKRSSAKHAGGERGSCELIDIQTADGWALRAEVHEPSPGGDHPVGLVVLAHDMMARRSAFDLPAGRGLVRLLVTRGWRVIAFDFRGHGDSAPAAHEGARYTYDELVTSDIPAVHAFARSRRGRKRPLILVGHSLGGHVALAAQGMGLVGFDGIAVIASNIWMRELEPSPARWLLKRAALEAAVAMAGRLGRFPARTLGLGSDDECQSYLADLARYARTGAWTSSDGRCDYLASLGRLDVPLLQVVSDGDLLACVPECGERFIARCGGPHRTWRITRGDGGGPPPAHYGLVTNEQARSVRERIETWMREVPIRR